MGTSRYDLFAVSGLERPDGSEDAGARLDNYLHAGSDDICPRCLTWIEERDFVRQTAFGLLQHEVCPRRVPA